MHDSAHIQLWDKCRQIIRDNIPAEQYDAWFRDIESYQFESNKLTLQVPSLFFIDQLEERYGKILVPALRRVYGPEVMLYFRCNTVKERPDTATVQKSTKPSGIILDQQKAQPANPFSAKPESDIDSQLNPRYNFDNYCEGESNQIARAIAMSIADNPKNLTFNPLFIFGPTGVGKTHLMQAIGVRLKENNPHMRVLYVTSRLFESQYTAAVASGKTNSFFHFYQSIDTLIVDDVQDLRGKTSTQNTFYHIFNHLHQLNKLIIMSSDCAPAEMDGIEARLLSRFKWGTAVELMAPDLELRRKVLRLKSEQNGLDIPEDVLEYIAATVTSSIRDLEGIIVSLIAHATVLGRDVDIDLARSVIERAVKVSKRAVNFEIITEEVCSHFGIDTGLLFTKTRKREVSDARQVVMYLAKKIAKMPLVAIGHKLDRTHATVNYACSMIEDRLRLDKQLQADVTKIQEAILSPR